jgi:mono/diheme cytochrome c family protein
MLRCLLCATSVLLCVSVVIACQRNFTTETQRATEFYRENSIAPQNVKESFDPATFYKPNCAECHGSEAEKKFNPDLPESQMIDSILNGAKAEGSKDMPAFAEKGIDEARAKVLITYMRSIRE